MADQSITALRPCGLATARCDNGQPCTCADLVPEGGTVVCADKRTFAHKWVWESPSTNTRVCDICGQKEEA